MPSSSQTPVAVLGAGLAGMSAAYHLGRRGVPHRIFERLPHPGGHAITLEDSGYRFDRTGHLLHLRDPSTRALALSFIAGGWVEIQRQSMIWTNGTYTRYPFQANTFGLPPRVAYSAFTASSRRTTRRIVPLRRTSRSSASSTSARASAGTS